MTITFYVITSIKDPGFIATSKPTQILSIGPNSVDYTSGTLPHTSNDPDKLKVRQESPEKEIEDENSGPITIGTFGQNPVISEPDEEVDYKDNSNPDMSRKSIGPYVETRACRICIIEQPLRSKHCIDCDRCVTIYDHHCPWLDNCIGEKNRLFFWWYLFFECILLASSVVYLGNSVSKTSQFWPWAFQNFLTVLSIVVCSFFELLVTFLLCFHTYLAFSNKTTWEVLSRKRITYFNNIPEGHNPFNLGVSKNLYFYCCKRIS